MKNLFKAKNLILDLLFPIQCLGCGMELENAEPKERWICFECLKKIKIRKDQTCPFCEEWSDEGKTHYRCKKETTLDGLWVATEYKYKIINEAIHKFKFSFIQDLSFSLSEILIRSILETEEYGDFQDLVLENFSQESGEKKVYTEEEKNKKVKTIIIPVPLHNRRYNWRGFNQAFLLSEHIANKFNLDICNNLLLRERNTKSQTKIKSMEERKKNIKGAFSISKYLTERNLISNNNVIIVDDVCTTSATLSECAKELKKAGAKNVWGLVVARR